MSETWNTPLHCWCHVMLDNSWKIIDCAGGAMKYNAGGNSSVRASGFYFTTNPEHFITRHFPSDDDGGSRQLLEKPIDLKTFQKGSRYE